MKNQTIDILMLSDQIEDLNVQAKALLGKAKSSKWKDLSKLYAEGLAAFQKLIHSDVDIEIVFHYGCHGEEEIIKEHAVFYKCIIDTFDASHSKIKEGIDTLFAIKKNYDSHVDLTVRQAIEDSEKGLADHFPEDYRLLVESAIDYLKNDPKKPTNINKFVTTYLTPLLDTNGIMDTMKKNINDDISTLKSKKAAKCFKALDTSNVFDEKGVVQEEEVVKAVKAIFEGTEMAATLEALGASAAFNSKIEQRLLGGSSLLKHFEDYMKNPSAATAEATAPTV